MNYEELNTKNEIKSKLHCKFIEADIFIKMIDKGLPKDYIFPIYLKSFKKYEKILNNKNIYFEKYFEKIEDKNKEDITTMFEKFSDLCYDEVNNNKVEKFKKLLSKNININNDTEDLLRELATLIEEDFFEKHIAKKSVAYDLEALHQSLNQNISILKKWNLEQQIDFINSFNTTIIFSDNNSVLFEVNDSEASLNLGVKNWCISRDEYTFDDYRSNFERIYFHYDFNENTPSTLKITAYVIDTEGNECEFQDKLNRKIQNYHLLDKIKTYFKPLTLEEKKLKLDTLPVNEQYIKILQEGLNEKDFSYLRDEIDIDYIFSQHHDLPRYVIKHNNHLLKEQNIFNYAFNYIIEQADIFKNVNNILLCKETTKFYKEINHDFKNNILSYLNYNYEKEDFDICLKLLKLSNTNFKDQLEKELLDKNNTCSSYHNVINYLNDQEKKELFNAVFFNKLFENRKNHNLTNILNNIPKEYFDNIDKVYIKQLMKVQKDNFDINTQKTICNLIGIFDESKKEEMIQSFLKRPREAWSSKSIIKSLNIELNNEQTETFLYQLFFELPKNEVLKLSIEEQKEEANYVALPKSFIPLIISSIPIDKNTLISFYNDNKEILCKDRSLLAKEGLEDYMNRNNISIKNKIKI